MKKLKLTDEQMAVMYKLVVDELEKVNRYTVAKYIEDLEQLELKLSIYKDKL